MARGPNCAITPLKSASFEIRISSFGSSFQNLRSASIVASKKVALSGLGKNTHEKVDKKHR